MTKREKLRQRIANNPKTVRFEDLEALLFAYHFTKTGSGSSHFKYQHLSGAVIVVAYRRPHLKVYAVKEALAAIEEVEVWERDR